MQYSNETKLIRLPRVREITGGMSKSGIYAAMTLGEFPRPVKIGKRAVAWVEAEVLAHVRSLIDARGRPA
jgi:prophage regulatory protein